MQPSTISEKDRVLSGIINSEERTARGGSLVLPTYTRPDYSLIPEHVKKEYDAIRVKYGVTPRWSK